MNVEDIKKLQLDQKNPLICKVVAKVLFQCPEEQQSIAETIWKAFNGNYIAGKELIEACKTGDEKKVEALLKQGADLTMVDENGNSALMIACVHNHSKIALQLIDKADVNIQNEDGNTALLLACRQGLEDVVSKLIEKGAKVDAVNDDGDSALILACRNGYPR